MAEDDESGRHQRQIQRPYGIRRSPQLRRRLGQHQDQELGVRIAVEARGEPVIGIRTLLEYWSPRASCPWDLAHKLHVQ